MKKTVCVDLDGVLADYSQGWQGLDHIGDPLPGAVEFTKRLSEMADVVIFTVRCNLHMHGGKSISALVAPVRAWLDKYGFSYSSIYAGQGKPHAKAYVDDKAVYCGVDGFIEPTKEYMTGMYTETLTDVKNLVEDQR